MKFSLDAGDATYRIDRYEPEHSVVVSGEVYRRSIVVLPDQLQTWPPDSFAALQREHFAMLLEFSPDVVLLGSGTHFRRPAPALTVDLVNHNIGLEVMDSAAACRTYSLLMAEGRRVAAALLI
jgi:uncharacterized protein